MKNYIFLLIGVLTSQVTSCGAASEDEYAGLISDGWAAYEATDYDVAFDNFTLARDADPAKAEAYTGLGWTEMRRDNLNEADGHFEGGSFQNDAGPDLYAGWAFASNASKSYTNSNTRASTALTADPAWNFEHQASLDFADLRVVRAENFFALGQFSQALAEVQILNGSFTVNAATSGGQALLAAEIERLKGISKLTPAQ